MQIQQAVQNIVTANHPLPAQILNQLAAGQQLEAVVVKAALEAQVATLKLADTLLDIRTPIPVKQGELVQIVLDQSSGKPVAKIIPPALAEPTVRTPPQNIVSLSPGQKLVAEVVKVLAENKVLLEVKPAQSQLIQAKTPAVQIEVDIAKINKQFSPAEKVQVEVISTKPLNVALSSKPFSRDQAIVERIQQLLTQQPTSTQAGKLTALNPEKVSSDLPSSVQKAIQNVLTHITDKHQVKQPQVLKQAIQQSGSFTEKQLLQKTSPLQQDFKANLSKLVVAIENEVERYQKAVTTVTREGTQPAKANEPATVTSSVTKPLRSPFAPRTEMSTPVTSNALPTNKASQLPLASTASTPTTQPTTITGGQQAVDQRPNPLRSPFAPRPQANVNQQSEVAQTTLKSSGQQVIADTNRPVERTVQQAPVPSNTQATPATTNRPAQHLPPLSALIQASLSHNASRPSLTVLSSPPQVPLPTSFTPFSDSVLTSPNQALAIAKMLSQSISPDQVRGMQMDLLVLQNLLREVESIQARVQLNQFSMLKESDTPTAPTASWLLDIPLKDKNDVDFLQLQIDQHHQSDNEEETNIWNVQLRLDTQNLGPLQATVTMHADEFKLILRAERAESAEFVEQHLAILHKSLSDLGVSVTSISCICGEVAKATLTERYLSETTSLVDISV